MMPSLKMIKEKENEFLNILWEFKKVNLNLQIELYILKEHPDGVINVAVTSDNNYIISGSWDNTIRVLIFYKKDKKLFCKEILLT